MTHSYNITGMTCSNCEAKVKDALLRLPGIISADINRQEGTAQISMSKHISLTELQNAISKDGKYKISAVEHNEMVEQTKSWLETYKPVLLIFTFITITTLLIQFTNPHFDLMQWMRHFMGGFFLVFSFFKILNLSGFADSYAMYDVIAKRIPAWGYLYAFIELGLGIVFIINFNPVLSNAITLIIMGISIVGVLQSVLNKRKIQCACLGAIFNLPMSTITIIEDALMIVMSAGTLFFISS